MGDLQNDPLYPIAVLIDELKVTIGTRSVIGLQKLSMRMSR